MVVAAVRNCIKVACGGLRELFVLESEDDMTKAILSEKSNIQDQMPQTVIKKYANRRLYDTESSTYITLGDLARMVRAGRDFVVYDAKTGHDITKGVLTQIIIEEEGKGQNLLPTYFLRQLIGFYGETKQTALAEHLERAMRVYVQQQAQINTAVHGAVTSLSNFFPFRSVEEAGRQNLAVIERALSTFASLKPNDPKSTD